MTPLFSCADHCAILQVTKFRINKIIVMKNAAVILTLALLAFTVQSLPIEVRRSLQPLVPSSAVLFQRVASIEC